MTKEEMIEHCVKEGGALWLIHAKMNPNENPECLYDYLRIEGKAIAYDEMAGFLKHGK